jgi:rare lipoprotein A (peptidoglycan hydrolase)
VIPPADAGPPPAIVRGIASWYADGPGLYAAAGPALRVGDWRGSWVTVTSGGVSVRVQLVDWCDCYGTRLVDLSPAAFAELAPLGRGLLEVTVAP